MSGKAVGMVFDHYIGRGAELLLAVKLADNAHDDGTSIYPSVATLALQTRQSERSVQYQLKRMVEQGWLVLVKHARGGGRAGGFGRPREYRIHKDWIGQYDSRLPADQRPTWLPTPATPSKQMGAEVAPICLGKWVQPDAEMGATAVAEMGAIAVAPEPSLTVIEPNTPLPPDGGERDFEKLWNAYPKKTAHGKALAEFRQVAPDPQLLSVMLAAVGQWTAAPEWQKDAGRWVPKLDRWLRESRWLDVPGVSAPVAKAVAVPEVRAVAAPMPESVRAYRATLGRLPLARVGA